MSRVLPILFNTDMVRAILDGRKTVTRRVIMPHNRKKAKEQGYSQGNGLWVDPGRDNLDAAGHIKDYSVSSCWMKYGWYIKKYAPYQPGDILYVRETWNWEPCWDCGMDTEEHSCCDRSAYKIFNHDKKEYGCYVYRASFSDNVYPLSVVWKPSIHMPKQAARIWLKVTNVRVERLQEMTLYEAHREGVSEPCIGMSACGGGCESCPASWDNSIIMFQKIWDSTIKKSDLDMYGWDADPWVWVIEFKRCEKPEAYHG